MSTEDDLDREMGYTDWATSCRHPHGDLLCRRSCTHTGDHAAGYGPGRVTWANTGDPRPEWSIVPVAGGAA